jgi:hypothetical protein
VSDLDEPVDLVELRNRRAAVIIHCGLCGGPAIWLKPGETISVIQPDVRCAPCEASSPTYSATERKEATHQALALLTASFCDDPDGRLIGDLIGAQGVDLPLVTVSVVGLASGLLRSFDDEYPGAARRWLESIGRRIESMPEGDE